MTEKRVAFYLPDMAGGGAEKVFALLANTIADRGWTVDMLLGRKKGVRLNELGEKIRVVEVGVLSNPFTFFRFLRYLKKYRPRTVMSGLDVNFMTGLAKTLGVSGVRFVANVRNRDDLLFADCRGGVKFYFFKLLYPAMVRAADHVIAVSRKIKEDYVVPGIGVDPAKVSVIHNPVLTGKIQAAAEAPPSGDWWKGISEPYVLAVGRLEPQKDYETLLKAFAMIRKDIRVKLIIVGEGKERGKLEALSRDLGLTADVLMPGYIPNPYPLMKKAAVFALSSRYEGFSNVLLEAMACGAPIVSTDCPAGPFELLEGGKFGRLVRVGDTEEFADALLDTLRVPRKVNYDGPLKEFELEGILNQYMRCLDLTVE